MIKYERLAGSAWVQEEYKVLMGVEPEQVEVIGRWFDSNGEWKDELLSLITVPVDIEDDYEKVASLAWAGLTANEQKFIKLYNDEATREEAKVLWALGFGIKHDN